MLEIINKAFIYYDKYYERINYIISKIDPTKTQKIVKTSDLQRNIIIFCAYFTELIIFTLIFFFTSPPPTDITNKQSFFLNFEILSHSE